MAQQRINVGVTANDGTGDPERVAFSKANSNFDELYGHTLDKTNPHGVTAAQVGTMSTAQINDALAAQKLAITQNQITPAQLATTIANLIGGSPDTLDTFIEVYNRFISDETAVAALMTLVGTKAPTLSPQLTGAPTAPTPPTGNNSTAIATTAFVIASGGSDPFLLQADEFYGFFYGSR